MLSPVIWLDFVSINSTSTEVHKLSDIEYQTILEWFPLIRLQQKYTSHLLPILSHSLLLVSINSTSTEVHKFLFAIEFWRWKNVSINSTSTEVHKPISKRMDAGNASTVSINSTSTEVHKPDNHPKPPEPGLYSVSINSTSTEVHKQLPAPSSIPSSIWGFH